MHNKWDIRFLEMAQLVASWSKDPSTKTGAVITMGKEVVSVGFNGFPVNMPDDEEFYSNREEKYSRIVHCEVNALIYAKRDVYGSTLYTWPFLSCDRCCVQMLQAGVQSFIAPRATPQQLERWGPAFDRSRQYIKECGADFMEVDFA